MKPRAPFSSPMEGPTPGRPAQPAPRAVKPHSIRQPDFTDAVRQSKAAAPSSDDCWRGWSRRLANRGALARARATLAIFHGDTYWRERAVTFRVAWQPAVAWMRRRRRLGSGAVAVGGPQQRSTTWKGLQAEHRRTFSPALEGAGDDAGDEGGAPAAAAADGLDLTADDLIDILAGLQDAERGPGDPEFDRHHALLLRAVAAAEEEEGQEMQEGKCGADEPKEGSAPAQQPAAAEQRAAAAELEPPPPAAPAAAAAPSLGFGLPTVARRAPRPRAGAGISAAGGGADAASAELYEPTLTKQVLSWVRRASPQDQREFEGRIRRLAAGESSRKTLNRHGGLTKLESGVLREAALSRGRRVLYMLHRLGTERKPTLRLLKVVHHDALDRAVAKIRDAESRMEVTARQLAKEHHDAGVEHAPQFHRGMMLDPWGSHTPAQFHRAPTRLLHKLSDAKWTPPYELSPQEQAVVEQEGGVMILGRSGTGKTECMCNRMEQDIMLHIEAYGDEVPLRQVFIARSTRLCQKVQGQLVERHAEAGTNATFSPIWNFVDWFDTLIAEGADEERFDRINRVDEERFCDEIYPKLLKRVRTLPARTAWTQIRCFIKGRFEFDRTRAFPRHDPLIHLSRDSYCSLGVGVCPLEADERTAAFDIFEHYDAYRKKHRLWDDCDRQTRILDRMKAFGFAIAQDAEGNDISLAKQLFDCCYVDEVQDATQLEIALVLSAVKERDPSRLFLAGDPAQSVESSVQFRFADVRDVVDLMNVLLPSGGKRVFKIGRPIKLFDNFRSSGNILRLAADLLVRMREFYPNSIPNVPADRGLDSTGPKPSVARIHFSGLGDDGSAAMADAQQGVHTLSLRKLLLQNPRATVLVRPEQKKQLRKIMGDCCPEHSSVCLDIRQSKGLEFDSVIVLNFFSGTQCQWWNALLQCPRTHWGAWHHLSELQEEGRSGGLILDLKLLYTAVTRCKLRLIFAEQEDAAASATFAAKQQHEAANKATRAACAWLTDDANHLPLGQSYQEVAAAGPEARRKQEKAQAGIQITDEAIDKAEHKLRQLPHIFECTDVVHHRIVRRAEKGEGAQAQKLEATAAVAASAAVRKLAQELEQARAALADASEQNAKAEKVAAAEAAEAAAAAPAQLQPPATSMFQSLAGTVAAAWQGSDRNEGEEAAAAKHEAKLAAQAADEALDARAGAAKRLAAAEHALLEVRRSSSAEPDDIKCQAAAFHEVEQATEELRVAKADRHEAKTAANAAATAARIAAQTVTQQARMKEASAAAAAQAMAAARAAHAAAQAVTTAPQRAALSYAKKKCNALRLQHNSALARIDKAAGGFAGMYPAVQQALGFKLAGAASVTERALQEAWAATAAPAKRVAAQKLGAAEQSVKQATAGVATAAKHTADPDAATAPWNRIAAKKLNKMSKKQGKSEHLIQHDENVRIAAERAAAAAKVLETAQAGLSSAQAAMRDAAPLFVLDNTLQAAKETLVSARTAHKGAKASTKDARAAAEAARLKRREAEQHATAELQSLARRKALFEQDLVEARLDAGEAAAREIAAEALTPDELIDRGLRLADGALDAETQRDAQDMLEQACSQFEAAKQAGAAAQVYADKARQQFHVIRCIHDIKGARTKSAERAAIRRAAKVASECLVMEFIDFAQLLCTACGEQRESARWVEQELASALAAP